MNRFPDIDTLSLRCFVSLHESGSFTKAAETIGRTQSAISQQIKKLEDITGKKLFERTLRNVNITPDGEAFLNYAKKILQIRQELFTHFKEPEVAGEIKFGTPEDFATLYLPEVLSAFSRSHPKVVLKVECDLTLNLLDKFKRNEYDIIIVKKLRSEEINAAETVWVEHLEWVGSSNLEIESKKDILPLVLSPNPCVYRKRALDALDKAGIKWKVVYSSPSFAGTVAAVRAGLGITVLPRKMVPGTLNLIKNKFLPNLHNTYITLLKSRNETPAMRSFAEYITSHLK